MTVGLVTLLTKRTWKSRAWIKPIFSVAWSNLAELVEDCQSVDKCEAPQMVAWEVQPVQDKTCSKALSSEDGLCSADEDIIKDFVVLIQKCRKQKDLAQAKHLHDHIRKCKLDLKPEIGNHLVLMLVECESVFEAREAFDKLSARMEYSWNALIQGYVECGEPQYAIDLYLKMHEESVPPNRYALQLLTKACCKLDSAEMGLGIHAEIAKLAVEHNRFVASALVDMYAKCGFLAEAQCVFDKLENRDIVLWTALIAGYAEHGPFEHVLLCFDQMKSEGIPPDAVTFVSFLKACSTLGGFDRGLELHMEIAKVALEGNRFIGSILVDLYIKCGHLPEAQVVFDSLPVHDVVLWNVLIGGYTEHELVEEALNCLKRMQREGILPTAVTFINSLKGCNRPQAIAVGHKLHADIIKWEFETDPLVSSTLVDVYIKCDSLEEAQDVFDELPIRNVITWTTLLSGYAEHGLGEDALTCLEQMQIDGVAPNDATYVCCLKACSSIGSLDEGHAIHALITCEGRDNDFSVGNTLVDMYAKCGSITEARDVFGKLLCRDVVSWNALISRCVEHGLVEDAFLCLEQMKEDGVSPDVVSYLSCLKACGSVGAIDRGQNLHIEISQVGFERDSFIGSTLVDVYGKCGLLVEAQEIFDQLPLQDLVSWNALLAGFAFIGDGDLVFHLFARMRDENIRPDGTTFLRILSVCNHVGFVDEGQRCFKYFHGKYGISPTVEHYNCLIDLLSRAGQLDEAVALLEKLPFQPNVVTWTTVLGACRKSGNVELGRRAFENSYGLDSKQAATFISMFNIYADAHLWEDAKLIEAMRLNL